VVLAGAFLATWIGQLIGWYRPDQGAGFIGATVVVLFIWNRLVAPRRLQDKRRQPNVVIAATAPLIEDPAEGNASGS
jgi:membrane protein implicated in regulation of membrane protease activity